MLTLDPTSRPSAEQLLKSPFIKNKKMSSDFEYSIFDDRAPQNKSHDGINKLLRTIKLPKNLKQLTERLPKSNYTDKRMKSQGRPSIKGVPRQNVKYLSIFTNQSNKQ